MSEEQKVIDTLDRYIDAVRALFTPDVRITLVVRHVKENDNDGIILTDDDLPQDAEKLIQLLRRFSPH